jgi:hypothetical protein
MNFFRPLSQTGTLLVTAVPVGTDHLGISVLYVTAVQPGASSWSMRQRESSPEVTIQMSALRQKRSFARAIVSVTRRGLGLMRTTD